MIERIRSGIKRINQLWRQRDSIKTAVWGVLAGFLILGNAAAYGFIRQDDTNAELRRVIEQQEADRLAAAKSGCESGNELRDLVREKLVEAPLEVGEAIIEIASKQANRPPNQAAIDALRMSEQERLTRIANDIPARRWDAVTQECVDVELNSEEN